MQDTPPQDLSPATTSHRPTADRIRAFFAYVPRGARYYLTTFDTPVIGCPVETTKQRVDALCRELRAGARDRTVTNVTVLVMYDGPTEGQGREVEGYFMLPLGVRQ